MDDQLIFGDWLLAESSNHLEGLILVQLSDVPMKMIWDCFLVGVDVPVSRSVELIAKVCGYHDNISHLPHTQLLEMSAWATINNDWTIALVAYQHGELIFVTNSWR